MSNIKKEYNSVIATPIHISESEIAIVFPKYSSEWAIQNIEELKNLLYELGMDTLTHSFELQPVIQHRNRVNKIVTCARYLGEERSDKEYLMSGYASTAAIDKAKNCAILDSMYRQKGLTEDAQNAAELKDFYRSKAGADE